MEILNQLSKTTKTLLVTGVILVIYGYLCRLMGIYFFWESKPVGWAVIFIGVISLLAGLIKKKKAVKKNTVPEKIGIGILVFILLAQLLLVVIVQFTDAYAVARSYLRKDAKLINETGTIHGFGLVPTGGISKTSGSEGEYGNATLNIIVKGDKKFKEVTVYVVKYADKPEWIVEEVD